MFSLIYCHVIFLLFLMHRTLTKQLSAALRN